MSSSRKVYNLIILLPIDKKFDSFFLKTMVVDASIPNSKVKTQNMKNLTVMNQLSQLRKHNTKFKKVRL